MSDVQPGGGLLAGLRVIEISSFVAAPLGGMTLSQLGADVIRVDPLGGAPDRFRWPLTKDGTSLYWAGLNKGKRSITADLRSEPGRQVVRDLVAACPPGTAVVLTNSYLQDWLSYESLSALQPDLIMVQIQGNHDGSPSVDYTVQAEVGFPMVTGPAGNTEPVNHVLPAWDMACGLYAALGVSAAARRREVTGEGDNITVALRDVALATAGNLGFLAEAQLNEAQRQPMGNAVYGIFANDFACADGGRFMIVALTRRHWRDLLAVTGTGAAVEALEAALGADFSREGDRFEYGDVLSALFQRWFSQTSTPDVQKALGQTDVLWSTYRSFAEAVAHLQTPEGANPLMEVLDQPGVGPYLAPGIPLVSSSSPTRRAPAPRLGQDTAQTLATELGLSAERIADLEQQGAVGPS